MDHTLLSENKELLRSLLGKEIVRVSRRIFWNDFDLPDFEQMGDGITELTFDSGQILSLKNKVETYCVIVKPEAMETWGESYLFREVTGNRFWQARVRRKIVRLVIHCDEDDEWTSQTTSQRSEFCLEIEFANGLKAAFIDAGQTSLTKETDALVIAAECDPPIMETIVIE